MNLISTMWDMHSPSHILLSHFNLYISPFTCSYLLVLCLFSYLSLSYMSIINVTPLGLICLSNLFNSIPVSLIPCGFSLTLCLMYFNYIPHLCNYLYPCVSPLHYVFISFSIVILHCVKGWLLIIHPCQCVSYSGCHFSW